MRSTRFLFVISFFVCIMSATSGLAANAQPGSDEVSGTWSGTFQSTHPETSPFTITIVIAPEPDGHLVGNASLASDCFKDGVLQVTLKGPTVVFAGSDPEGNNITFRGGLDDSRTLLKMHYVVNGSASARCESDEGEGSLVKR